MDNVISSEISDAGKQVVHSEYVDLMRQRALGELPDMGCALSLVGILRQYVLGRHKNSVINKLIDVGCATGHYARTLSSNGISIQSYVGLEINAEMFQAACEVWRSEIAAGSMHFVHDDIESSNLLEPSDVVICFNSFMYYKSAKAVLRKFLRSSKLLVIRSYFADNNFRILRAQCRQNNDRVTVDELDIFDDSGALLSGDFWTIYSFSYIESILKEIEPRAKVTWLKDQNSPDSIIRESSMGVVKRGGTEMIGGYEISYPLLQPWGIALISVD